MTTERWRLAPTVALGLGVGLLVAARPLLAALAIAGAVFGVFVVARPARMVPLLFLAVLFDQLGVSGVKVSGFPVTASKLSVVGLIGVWGLHVLLTRRRPALWHPVLGGLAVFALGATITAAVAASMSVGKFTVIGLAMMLVLVGLVYAILADEELGPRYRAIGVFVAAVLALSLIGGGGSGEAARASGTMGDPNEWATMVFVTTPFLLGGLVDDEHPLARPLRVALLGLAPLSVLASGSRAALLVLGLVVLPGAIWLCWRRREELAVVAGGAALVALVALDFSKGMERFRSLLLRLRGESTITGDASLDERTELLHQGLQLFSDHLLLGSGPGTFAAATGFVSTDGRLRPAHNTYLEVAAEQGLLGLCAGGIFAATVAWTLRAGWKAALTPRDRHRVLGVAVGLAAVAAMGATLGLLTFSMAYLVLGFGLAVVHQAAARGG